MSDEQKIEGVPEVAIRAPKPKRRVLIAEFELRNDEVVSGVTGLSYFDVNTKNFRSAGPREASAVRIEERDA